MHCPTPDKRGFLSIKQARKARAGTGNRLWVYRCPCNKYHVSDREKKS